MISQKWKRRRRRMWKKRRKTKTMTRTEDDDDEDRRSPDLNHGEAAFLEELLDNDLRVVTEHFLGGENHLRIFDEGQDSPQVGLVLDVPADRVPRHSARKREGEGEGGGKN